MNVRRLTAEDFIAAKKRAKPKLHEAENPKVLEQRMHVVPLPADKSGTRLTLCTINAWVALESTAPPKAQIIQIHAHVAFVYGDGENYAYVVDADANTCTCPAWRKHHDCHHIKAVREHFYI